jgi:phosphoglycolate phosphatase
LKLRGILFDLDGTLADTAPDLVAVLNTMLTGAGRPPVPYAIARNEVSNGAAGLLRLGYALGPEDPVDTGLRDAFLSLYAGMGHTKSRLFIDLRSISEIASGFGAAWGIVTNKPDSLTRGLLQQLGILDSVATLVCGDTLPERKPHPAPLLRAAAELGLPGSNCVYIGDARRDIEAGRAAGMHTLATSYGYIRPGEDIADWGADAVAVHPRDLLPVLKQLEAQANAAA